MRILFDLTSVSGGGGLEQSAALLHALEAEQTELKITCVVRENSRLLQHLSSSRFDLVTINRGIASRAWHYMLGLSLLARKRRVDLIYVPFGVGGLTWGVCPQVINIAYPILCYPDSPFWSHLPALSRIQTKLKCIFRRVTIRSNAIFIVAESEGMASRLIRYAAFSRKKLCVIPPIIGVTASGLTKYLCDGEPCEGTGPAPDKHSFPRCLLVTSAAPHKNIWRLGAFAEELAKARRDPITFVLTVSLEDYVVSCRKAGVDNHLRHQSESFLFRGALGGSELIKEIQAADVIMNISDLESISNNFIEAAAARKPMIIAKRDFSLLSVRTPFVACEPHAPRSFVEAIDDLRANRFECPSAKSDLAISGREKSRRLIELFRRIVGGVVAR